MAPPGSVKVCLCILRGPLSQIDRATIAWCKSHGVALESYSVLHATVPMSHPTITAVAARHNVSNAQVMIKYVSQLGISVVSASHTKVPHCHRSSASPVSFGHKAVLPRYETRRFLAVAGALSSPLSLTSPGPSPFSLH